MGKENYEQINFSLFLQFRLGFTEDSYLKLDIQPIVFVNFLFAGQEGKYASLAHFLFNLNSKNKQILLESVGNT